jgi:hypothetical protein
MHSAPEHNPQPTSSPNIVNTTNNLQEDIDVLKNAVQLKKQIEELNKNIVHNGSSSSNEITDESKICITVLTKGYTNKNKYYKLIERNKCIEKQISNKNVDILIFHEGNISSSQQTYISIKTPSLRMRFIDVTGSAFKNEKTTVQTHDVKSSEIGYRHMNSFWFIDFWNFVEEYDYLIRIDEDCFVMFDPLSMIVSLKDHHFVSGGKHNNNEGVESNGLNEFTLSFIKQNDTHSFAEVDRSHLEGPYTNVFGIALHAIRNSYILYKYQEDVSHSNHIYQYHWSDVSLWEEVIHYIFGDKSLYIDANLTYLHESNNSIINNL